MDLQLSGRTAAVTGASKGIGPAVARTLLDEGANVVAASRRSTPEMEALAGPHLVHVSADFRDPEAPARVAAKAVEAFGALGVLGALGALGILVNNAGGPQQGIRHRGR